MRVSVLALACCFSILSASFAGDAAAAARRHTDIPPEDLASALKTLARDRQFQVLFRSDLVRDLRTPGATGEYTPNEALTLLLTGTGLTFQYIDSNTVTVVPVAEVPSSAAPRSSGGYGTPDSSDMQSPRDLLRLAQVDPREAGKAAAVASSPQYIPGTLSSRLEEVVVTAEKRTEKASTTPIALSVISGEQLKESGVISVANLGDVAPNLTIDRSLNGVNIFLRGVTTTDPQSAASPGVDFNIDGVTIGQRKALGVSLFDIDRLEVLRGPQGTLYGANSPGGVINVVTNRPRDDFEAAADAEIGNYNTKRGSAVANLPVNEFLDLRLALNRNDREGYLTLSPTGVGSAGPLVDGSSAALNAEHDQAGRLGAFLKFNPTATLLLQYTYGVSTGPNYGTVNLCSPLNASGSCAINFSNESASNQRSAWTNPVVSSSDEHSSALNGQLNVEFAGVQLTYSGGFAHYTVNDVNSDTGGLHGFGPPGTPNGTGTYLWNYQRAYFNTVENELRFSNAKPGERVDWVAGLSDRNYVDHELSPGFNFPVYNAGTPNQTYGPLALDQATNLPYGITDKSSEGVYANATIHFTDKIRFTVGGRESRDTVSKLGVQLNAMGGPEPGCTVADIGAGDFSGCNVLQPDNGSVTSNKFTWRTGIDYRPTDSQMAYLSASTGFKPGGFNDQGDFMGAYAATPYGPESLTAYELGYKVHANDTLELNTDLYYYDYAEMQVTAPQLNSPNPFNPFVVDTPTTIYGLEADGRWLLSADDLITGALTLEKSKYNNLHVYPQGAGGPVIDWTDQPLSLAPGFTLNIGYSHTWMLASGDRLRAHLGSKFSGAYYIDDINSGNAYSQAPFHRTDLDLTYTRRGDKFYAMLFVKNIEDKVQETFYQGPGCFLCGGSVGISDPMFYGLRLGVRN